MTDESQNKMICPTCEVSISLPRDRPMALLCTECASLILFEDVVAKKPLPRPRVATRLDWLALADAWPRIHAALTCDLAEATVRLWKAANPRSQ